MPVNFDHARTDHPNFVTCNTESTITKIENVIRPKFLLFEVHKVVEINTNISEVKLDPERQMAGASHASLETSIPSDRAEARAVEGSDLFDRARLIYARARGGQRVRQSNII